MLAWSQLYDRAWVLEGENRQDSGRHVAGAECVCVRPGNSWGSPVVGGIWLLGLAFAVSGCFLWSVCHWTVRGGTRFCWMWDAGSCGAQRTDPSDDKYCCSVHDLGSVLLMARMVGCVRSEVRISGSGNNSREWLGGVPNYSLLSSRFGWVRGGSWCPGIETGVGW